MTILVVSAILVLLLLGIPMAVVMGLATILCILVFTNIPLQTVFQQVFQGAEIDLLQAVIFFIASGSVMTRGKLASKLIRVGRAMVGGLHGGLAITGVLASIFFAAISGSSPATLVAIGTIMIPALIKNGYGERFSIGLLTSSGTLGIMIPPSIPMIIWGVVMGVSITKQFMAGFLPGMLLGGVLMVYSYLQSKKNNWKGAERFNWREMRLAFREGIWSIFMPVLVLGGIYTGIFTSTEAAFVSFVYAMFVEFFIHRSLTLRDLMPILKESVLTSSMLLFIIANASVLSYYFSIDEIPAQVANYLTQFIPNKYLFLFLVNMALLIMGCLMDVVSALFVLGPIFQPFLQKYGIDPIHFGIIMVLNIEIGFITPPFGVNLFVASGLTKKGIFEIGRSVAPCIALMLAVLLIITYVPWISLVLTELVK
ncbi:MAG: TRAP transporter large permease [Thermodesulfobacteriota bacterium]